MINPIKLASTAKGRRGFLTRVGSIGRRYGLTASKMDRALAQFSQVLDRFDCSATFPVTSVALARNGRVIAKYQERGIEFAVHGYVHVDHSQISLTEQVAHLARARAVFQTAGVRFSGFRCPYLRWNQDTLRALTREGFDYDSSQALFWDVIGDRVTLAYQRVLGFYGARPAADYPALPRLEGELVRIPYCVPDDEALVERLAPADDGSGLWGAILQRTYELGELFTLGLHPERIGPCRRPLTDTLSAARQLSPAVWIARLDQIATWWRARTQARVEVAETDPGEFQVAVDGPAGTSVLVRGVEVDAPSQPWAEGYQQVQATSFSLRADKRPVVGVPPGSSEGLVGFLRQQGYIVEIAAEGQRYSVHLDRTELVEEDERGLLARLEQASGPLLRLGRWPDGARSALCVSGDIDALTLWDYGLRFVGR